jgi:hypothetical protein
MTLQKATVTRQPPPVVRTTVSTVQRKRLPQGTGGSGTVVYDYSAHAQNPPKDKDIKKPGLPFDITLPLLIYPPAILNPPKVDLFVFFHGMRAEYGEGKSQGSEPIALWAHLQEAVAGTDRLGIAPQAPATWRIWDEEIDDPDNKGKKKTVRIWEPATDRLDDALVNICFAMFFIITLNRHTRDLALPTPLVPGEIHVAGHSAGGKGIIEATNRDAGAKTYGDMVQDVTLQDAGLPRPLGPSHGLVPFRQPGKDGAGADLPGAGQDSRESGRYPLRPHRLVQRQKDQENHRYEKKERHARGRPG